MPPDAQLWTDERFAAALRYCRVDPMSAGGGAARAHLGQGVTMAQAAREHGTTRQRVAKVVQVIAMADRAARKNK